MPPGVDIKVTTIADRQRTAQGNRRKQIVDENVVKRMSIKRLSGDDKESNDFTIHITEAGEEVRTTSRIIKGERMLL